MNRRLNVAATLLFARAGWTGLTAVSFLGVAAVMWANRPTGPTTDGNLVGALLTITLAGALALLGVVAAAIAIPSLVFGILVRTGKRRAYWVVVVGESMVAMALIGAMIWSFTHPQDLALALAAGVALALVSIPVIVLLLQALTRSRPAESRHPG